MFTLGGAEASGRVAGVMRWHRILTSEALVAGGAGDTSTPARGFALVAFCPPSAAAAPSPLAPAPRAGQQELPWG